jgi:hypothetical protein
MVRSEGNMSLKNPVTPPAIDPGTVRLVAQRLNHEPPQAKDVRESGYFWKPKGVREQKSLGNTPLNQCFLTFDYRGTPKVIFLIPKN